MNLCIHSYNWGRISQRGEARSLHRKVLRRSRPDGQRFLSIRGATKNGVCPIGVQTMREGELLR